VTVVSGWQNVVLAEAEEVVGVAGIVVPRPPKKKKNSSKVSFCLCPPLLREGNGGWGFAILIFLNIRFEFNSYDYLL